MKYKGVTIPTGYFVAFKNVTKAAAQDYAKGARSARFTKKYDASRAKILRVGTDKKDYIVVVKSGYGHWKP